MITKQGSGESLQIFNLAKGYEYSCVAIEPIYKSLSQKILKDTNNYKEKAIIIDKNNNIVLEKLGERNIIKFTDKELKKMDGCRLVHNHPSGMTLSEADIKLALDYNLKEIVAFSGKGKFYKLIIKDNLNKKELVLQYENIKKKTKSILLRLKKSNQLTSEHIKAEYQYFVISAFANNNKGIKYEISN
ncbi:MAG: hypothetical protein JJW00_07050 [Sulfurimonas sp.]|nr:hypothetical protein [Sulfurimonas sp.]